MTTPAVSRHGPTSALGCGHRVRGAPQLLGEARRQHEPRADGHLRRDGSRARVDDQALDVALQKEAPVARKQAGRLEECLAQNILPTTTTSHCSARLLAATRRSRSAAAARRAVSRGSRSRRIAANATPSAGFRATRPAAASYARRVRPVSVMPSRPSWPTPTGLRHEHGLNVPELARGVRQLALPAGRTQTDVRGEGLVGDALRERALIARDVEDGRIARGPGRSATRRDRTAPPSRARSARRRVTSPKCLPTATTSPHHLLGSIGSRRRSLTRARTRSNLCWLFSALCAATAEVAQW